MNTAPRLKGSVNWVERGLTMSNQADISDHVIAVQRKCLLGKLLTCLVADLAVTCLVADLAVTRLVADLPGARQSRTV